MTARERFVKSLTFGRPDRVYYDFGAPRRSTMEAWYLQGLPRWPLEGEYGHPPELHKFIGTDPRQGIPPCRLRIFPAFEEKTIEESAGHRVWVDGDGIVMEDAGKDLNTPGFRTRKYLRHPVQNRQDWLRMRDEHWDPNHPGRFPADWTAQAAKLKGHTAPIQVVMLGPYWKARDWCGFEGLSMMFYDEPALVHEMMDHCFHFILTMLERVLSDVEVDSVMISEDMCYKHAMMISPATFREFMMPGYRRMADFLRGKGVPVLAVDSDGHNGQIIPLLIEAGFNAVSPMEIAAHNDPVAFRKEYGRDMAFFGGIDKRELTTREKVYKEVMGKVPFLLDEGGYIPGVDHGVPPTVHLRGYLYMVELIKAIAEGKKIPGPKDALGFESQLGPVEKMWSIDMGLADDEEE